MRRSPKCRLMWWHCCVWKGIGMWGGSGSWRSECELGSFLWGFLGYEMIELLMMGGLLGRLILLRVGERRPLSCSSHWTNRSHSTTWTRPSASFSATALAARISVLHLGHAVKAAKISACISLRWASPKVFIVPCLKVWSATVKRRKSLAEYRRPWSSLTTLFFVGVSPAKKKNIGSEDKSWLACNLWTTDFVAIPDNWQWPSSRLDQ